MSEEVKVKKILCRQLQETKTPCSPAGSKEKTKYEMRMTKTGHKYIKAVETINIYDRIQDKKDECDAKQIVKRATMGDPNAIARIKQVKTNYGDTTLMPRNLMEAQQMINDGKRAFDNLPKEIKEQFNNDHMQFLADEKKVAKVTEEYLISKGAIKNPEKTEQNKTQGDDKL